MKHFFRKLDRIDSIIQSGASPENAKDLAALMDDPASRVYALEKIDESWLEPLESIGYFRELSYGSGPKKGEPQAGWPASAYLKRIAPAASNNISLARTLQRVLSLIPEPGNFYAFRDIVDTSLLLPREMRRGVAPFIQRAIGNRLSMEFTSITTLVNTLAEEGEIAAAIRLFMSVFSVFPVSNQPSIRKAAPAYGPASFMDAWHYKEQLEKCAPILTRVGGLRFLSCIIKLLTDYIRLENSRPEFQGPDDLSYIWRPAVESHAQNIQDDARDSLVTAIRECAESIASQNPESFGSVTELLDSQQWFIFTRVLLYLLSKSPTAPLNLIAHYVTQPYLFSEITVRHEYSLLLRYRFRVLTEEQQDVVLTMIENGPSKLDFVRAMKGANGEPPSEEQVQNYIGGWKLDWLSFIADDLRGGWRLRYEVLQAQLPPPLHPEFPYYMHSDWGLVGRSPYARPVAPEETEGETAGGAIERVLGKSLGDKEPTGAELDRLIEELQAAAEANPQLILERIEEIIAQPPRYLAPIATALANHVGPADAKFMSPLLRIVVAVVGNMGEAEDLEEREKLRNCLVGILDKFFADDGLSLEPEHLLQLRRVVVSLLSTVKLALGRQAQNDSEDFDPLFWAINSIDGRIVEHAIKLALRDRKFQGETDYEEPQWLLQALSDLLATMPPDEVQITAVLGYRFPWLVHLSRGWATKNAEEIFPLSPERRWRWEAAWCTYVGFSGAYNDVLEILGEQYAKAVNEVSTKHIFKKSRLDPDQGLAQHLAIYYWRQLITLRHKLLTEFLTLGGERPAKSFISYIGRGMSEVKDVPPEVTDSLRRLAEWMVLAWKPRRRNTKVALSALGWWFPHEFLGDADWRLRILRGAAKKAGDIDNMDQVLTELDQLATERPTLVVDCLKALALGKHRDPSSYFLASHSFSILEKAATSATAGTKVKICDIADYFGSRGHFEYRRFARTPSD